MSALYPAPSALAMAWHSLLRATLASLARQVRRGSPIDTESLARDMENESPEAAELGAALEATLEEFGTVIGELATAFGLVPSTMLIAFGRGEEIGEIDPVVGSALRDVAEIRVLTSSGTVTIEKDGRATTLVAATTVGPPTGPVRIAWPDRDDVWLCAVPAAAAPVLTARAALERILPHVGVGRAHLRTGPGALHAALLAIDPASDPDLVMARLEGWRAALEQLHRGAVAIHWEQS